MFSFKAPKQDPLNTRPEIAVENKNYIISVFYTLYWGVTTMVMLISCVQTYKNKKIGRLLNFNRKSE